METQRSDDLTPREFPVQWGNRHGTNNCYRMPLVALLKLEEGEEAGGGEPVRKKVSKALQRNHLVTSREVGWCLPGRAGRREPHAAAATACRG